VVVTESLGAFGWIAPTPVAITWLLLAAGAFWLARRKPPAAGADPLDALAIRAAPLTWAVVGGLLLVTLVTGLVSAPNAWDAVTYHLPRVERWVEQGHLGFWPTPTDRQLWMLPWSSYAILQLRLLTGGDLLAFLPSWLAYAGCVVLTAHLVRRLGGTPRQAASGALLMAAIPVAALHASSVQTDLTSAFWVLCVVALSIEAWREPAPPATDGTWPGWPSQPDSPWPPRPLRYSPWLPGCCSMRLPCSVPQARGPWHAHSSSGPLRWR
jgi:hypothetical protein